MMNTKYSYTAYREQVLSIRERVPGISVTTDIIVGFPGETERDYEETMRALEDLRFDGMFGFKYSKRQGTRAAAMDDQVPENIKTERINRLLKTQEDITLQVNKSLEGSVQEILIEGPSDTDPDKLMGRTRTNKIVTVLKSGKEEGAILPVKIHRARHHSLDGEIFLG